MYIYNLTIIIFIVIFVYKFLKVLFKNNIISLKTYEKEWLEFIWTLFPGFILVYLGIPSIELLYNLEIKRINLLTLKIIGNQWYWRYEYSRFKNIQFDSFIIPYNELKLGDFRLLEVDNSLVLPFDTNILCLVTSNDVIHRWSLPSINIKIDANPGRLNSFFLYRKLPGIFYGQCSEICGANHSFIPIKLEICNSLIFKNWIIIF